MNTERYSPPFVHPRRDPYLRRARMIAAAFLSIAQAAWFMAFVVVISNGAPLTTLFSLTGIVGLILIASRSRDVSDLALATVDHTTGLEFVPTPGDILRRFVFAIVVSGALLGAAFWLHASSVWNAVALALLGASEVIFRLGGLREWQSTQIHFPVLKALLTNTSYVATDVLLKAPPLPNLQFEMTVLAISSAAIRDKRSDVLQRLVDYLEEGKINAPQRQRLLAILQADEAMALGREDADILEAQALVLLPAGHPRRFSLALMVATRAMEAGDFANAIKALGLLHSRDALAALPRLLVDWLMHGAAIQIEDDAAAQGSRAAIRTFNIQRTLRQLNIEELRQRADTQARWLCKAHDALLTFNQPSQPARGSALP